MIIEKHTVVSINYTLKDDAGVVIDSSEGRGPLSYLHGAGGLIPGLETALEGKQKGDTLKVAIAPEDAYGQRDESLLRSVDRSLFQVEEEIVPGMQFQGKYR